MLPGISTALTAIAALTGVLILIGLTSRVARLGGLARRKPGGHSLTVRDAIALDSRRRLYLVHCEGHDVLLLTGGTQDILLGWLGRASVVEGIADKDPT